MYHIKGNKGENNCAKVLKLNIFICINISNMDRKHFGGKIKLWMTLKKKKAPK